VTRGRHDSRRRGNAASLTAVLQPAPLLQRLPAQQSERHHIAGAGKLGVVFHARVLKILHQVGAPRTVTILLVQRLRDRVAKQRSAVMALPEAQEAVLCAAYRMSLQTSCANGRTFT
jgi:hypothetical protein